MTTYQVNDLQQNWLLNQGQAGANLTDEWAAHQLALVKLVGTGLGTVNDNWHKNLSDYGYSGTLTDRWVAYLKAKTGKNAPPAELQKLYFAGAQSFPLESLTNADDEMGRVDFAEGRVGEASYISDNAGTLAIASADVRRFQYFSEFGHAGQYNEAAGTNLITYSEQLDNGAWTLADATVTADQNIAPDGSTTMDVLANTDGGTAIGTVTQGYYGFGTTTAGTWSGSVWLSAAAAGTATVSLVSDAGTTISTDVTLSTTPTRFKMSQAFDAGGSGVALQIHCGRAAGSGLAGVRMWGAQLERGAAINYSTSYIPTVAAIVSRANSVTSTGDPGEINRTVSAEKGTLCFKFTPEWSIGETTNAYQSMFRWSKGNGLDGRSMYTTTGGFWFYNKPASGSDFWSRADATITKGKVYRLICTWDGTVPVYSALGTDYHCAVYLSVDGAAYANPAAFGNADAPFTFGATYNIGSFIAPGSDYASGRYSGGGVSHFKTFKDALSLADATQLWGQ